ncbi:cysteine hydrolase family protein [Nocardioides bruguierae]|uniref:Cysteine hydrolase n=1 Tax=Nocardioides bruguierae TaxID=2945102 RepID=A0A9X2D5N2_9ACTN|nr:cysteine hydrolase family protein [Nocardioides bruguierae]MCL8026457.1 cysteine hydrolase [Nocardioides bruguierae]MCM0619520.1 cysteine hydrolase [Nocardioides bruguierae]
MSLETNAALLVIDVQEGFKDPSWGERDNPDAEANIGRLVQAWQASDRPVIVVRHDSTDAGSTLRPGQPGNDLVPEVAAIEPALFITKAVNSCFYGTPSLEDWLREHDVSQLVIVGGTTNHCVETTSRMAGNLGFDTTLALDATWTYDLEGPGGLRLSAQQLSDATAVNLQGGEFARVRSTDEVLADL